VRPALRFVVFDLDGTLVDSRRDIADAANILLERNGGAPIDEEAIGRMVGEGAALLVQRAFEAASRPPPADALQQFIDIYAARLLVHTRTYEGIPEVLSELRESRRVAVLTNKPETATRTILAGLGMSGFFPPEFIVGGDSAHGRKPGAGGLNWLMRQAAAGPDETVLVGDSMIDWHTARAAGAGVCLAGYGFGFEGIPEEIVRTAAVARSPWDILRYVKNGYG
jgi:phosphoglycolate phosphatase